MTTVSEAVGNLPICPTPWPPMASTCLLVEGLLSGCRNLFASVQPSTRQDQHWTHDHCLQTGSSYTSHFTDYQTKTTHTGKRSHTSTTIISTPVPCVPFIETPLLDLFPLLYSPHTDHTSIAPQNCYFPRKVEFKHI